jgi:glutamate-1-semialdehyde aminotransferase
VVWLQHNLPDAWPEGSLYHAYVRVTNAGERAWRAHHPEGKCVELVLFIDDVVQGGCRLPHDVVPGQSVTLAFPITFPEAKGGPDHWSLKLAFVEQHVAWFEKKGGQPLLVTVRKQPADRSAVAEALAVSRRSNWAFYAPSQGVSRSRNGKPYPLFLKEARGCRVRDLEGNEWIDYVMGWGSVLLGYAHPEIQQAIARQLDSGAVLSLPHELEMQVTKLLCESLPCAEMALFGKNGSDACTAAIRVARLHTGRRKLLCSGYHGWHDWYAEALAPELAAPSVPPSVFRFALNDLATFCRLVKEHDGDIAAVMLEPAAQVEGVDGPVRDVDPAFLANVAEICRDRSIVLIFDEIMTGFRYAGGSVQQATGVIPDLACFGKALTSGMPLSVLVGRRAVMERTLSRLFYHPTFKGEVYSFAAAVAALRIYQSRDVPGAIRNFGVRLKDGINRLSRELGVAGQMVGLPYRMVYRFEEPDEHRRCLKRTLLIQELLLHGILTFRGFLLPSLAHGQPELEQTLAAFRAALERVRDVSVGDVFEAHLEIPLVC